jgi:hypothetical protein
MKKQKRVKIINVGFFYPSYESWITTHFIKYRKHWQDGMVPDRSATYRIVGSAPHYPGSEIMLLLIKNVKTRKVYIIEELGVKEVQE